MVDKKRQVYAHEFYLAHKDEIKSYSHDWYIKHRKEWKAKTKKYRETIYKNPKKLKVYRKKCREKATHFRAKLKYEILSHYSPKVQCVKCGFADIRALSIDHMNGKGKQHRIKIDQLGFGFYGWLKKNKFPKGFQVLCMNCQFIKRVENHEYTKRRKPCS